MRVFQISNILDKITNTLLKDNALRKKNKKVTYALLKLNPRSATFTTTDQVQEMKQALQDSSSATDVGKPHTAMSPALYSSVPVHQGTPMNTIHTHHHVHRTTTLYP